MTPPTVAEQIAWLEGELHHRGRVFPRLVAARKITRARAEREVATIRAILAVLRERGRGERRGSATAPPQAYEYPRLRRHVAPESTP